MVKDVKTGDCFRADHLLEGALFLFYYLIHIELLMNKENRVKNILIWPRTQLLKLTPGCSDGYCPFCN